MIHCKISFDIKQVTLYSHYSLNVSLCLLPLPVAQTRRTSARQGVVSLQKLCNKTAPPQNRGLVSQNQHDCNQEKSQSTLFFWRNLVLHFCILGANLADLSAVHFGIF